MPVENLIAILGQRLTEAFVNPINITRRSNFHLFNHLLRETVLHTSELSAVYDYDVLRLDYPRNPTRGRELGSLRPKWNQSQILLFL